MSFAYDPSPAAVPHLPWNITFLTQRDVALQIPINFVNAAGVSVAAACFANDRYEEYATARCISNLLSVGFRKLVFDLYWDRRRQSWSLCPVEIPTRSDNPTAIPETGNAEPTSAAPLDGGPATTDTASEASASTSSGVPASSDSDPSRGIPQSNFAPTASADTGEPRDMRNRLALLHKRQLGVSTGSTAIVTTEAKETTVSKATLLVSLPTTTNGTIAILPTQTPLGADEVLYSIGPYKCSPGVDLSLIISVIKSFLDNTDNTLEAVLKFLILNIHAASRVVSPTGPEPTLLPTDLDAAPQLGETLRSALPTYIFRARDLFEQRANLNQSWYMAANFTAPEQAYYNIEVNENNVAHTDDGWASESYIEFGDRRRIIVAFGTVDSEMENYNIEADEPTIFSPNFLQSSVEVSQSADGFVSSGCFFDRSDTSLSTLNSSWAVDDRAYVFQASGLADFENGASAQAVQNLTHCGIAAFLNNTLGDATADVDPEPYMNFVYNSVWSWLPGEPRSKVGNDHDDFRCAAFDPTQAGRWYVANCRETHRGACRGHGRPHEWSLTTTASYYSAVSDDCPTGYSFAVPRTALENRYLLSAYRDAASQNSNGRDVATHQKRAGLPPLWLNLNSLDVKDCWVSGPQSTCPYVREDNSERIYVPTIAALIVLILAALTLLVKCGANRSKSRRRRRLKGDDHGWDYEGVPS